MALSKSIKKAAKSVVGGEDKRLRQDQLAKERIRAAGIKQRGRELAQLLGENQGPRLAGLLKAGEIIELVPGVHLAKEGLLDRSHHLIDDPAIAAERIHDAIGDGTWLNQVRKTIPQLAKRQSIIRKVDELLASEHVIDAMRIRKAEFYIAPGVYLTGRGLENGHGVRLSTYSLRNHPPDSFVDANGKALEAGVLELITRKK
jgi:hypothetical protein